MNPNPNPNDPYRSQGQSQRNPFDQTGNPFSSSTERMPVAQLSIDERLDFIRKTYSFFMAGILCALAVGYATMTIPELGRAAIGLWQMPLLALVLMFGLSFGAQAVSRVEGLNYLGLFGFTGFIGFWLTPLLVMYQHMFPGLVAQAGVLTLITFGALTAYAFVSKKDFSFLSGILFVGLVALILGGLANMFLFKSSMASYLMAWVSLVIFSGFVLYDTSNIMRTNDRKGYVSAALQLFLNFINLFLAILRILAGSRR